MSKEMVISATPHETRVAILEDGQLCEIYVEREKEFALVGSIYKGRVTRVLPGMQSAFVEIGLDSDAFLYVSDFLEDIEDYDQVVTTVEEKVQKMEEQGGQVFSSAAAGESQGALEPADVVPPAEPSPATSELAPQEHRPAPPPRPIGGERYGSRGHERPGGFGRGGGGRPHRGGRPGRGGRGRDDRPRGRELPPSKYASHRPYEPPSEPVDPNYQPIILPGESLAKYKDRMANLSATSAAPAAAEENSHVETATEQRVEPVAAPIIEEREHIEPAPRPEPAREPYMRQTGFVSGLEPLPGESIAKARASARPPDVAAVTEHAEEAAPALEASTFAPPTNVPEVQEPESPKSAAIMPPAAEPPSETELTPEEATSLAEQVAEAQSEEAEREEEATAEAAADEEDAAAGEAGHENGEAGENSGAATESSVHADGATNEAVEEMEYEGAPAEEAEAAPAEGATEEAQPSSARVQSDSRARLQHPMRRGGGRRREQQRGRPHHGGGHRPQPRRPQLIGDMLKQGQEIIVQIAKEPLGKKGARITSHIALPGRYLVYMPTLDHTGVSRKIASAEERARLRHIVSEAKGSSSGGFIVRTAADRATEEEIRTDVEYLTHTWADLKSRGEQRNAPSLLHRDLNLVERILRDYLSPDYSAIWVDNEEEFTKVVDFVSRFQPQMVNRVKLYSKDTPVYEEFGIQQEIDKGLRPKVWLKSGGYIVINHTEALVAIDVNTGKFVGRGSTRLEDTIVRTNLEAVKEIVRQMRLRDLGGIIVIDFIDMEERRNREKVMAALEDALKADRAPSKVLRFNEFGLINITRKRTKQALERTLCQPCPYCTGSGMVKSIPTLCYEIQTEARKMAPEIMAGSLTLRVHPEIAKALKTRESGLMEELERWTHKSIIIQADPTLHWEQYDIY
jgi:Rne/Rng family ribonuclease